MQSIVSQDWELIDPNPDPVALFIQFNNQFFWGKLQAVTVSWSERMTSCAGVCSYEGRGGLCSIRLSYSLLKFRPRKDLVETLLHEMIHAYLFVTAKLRDRDAHGPNFQSHMRRINSIAKTNITIYHNFYDEVSYYRTHVWKCDGPCRNVQPYYGIVKRAMNRAPGPNDTWWSNHQRRCGGTYHKISEPEEFTKKQEAKELRLAQKKQKQSSASNRPITDFFGKTSSKERDCAEPGEEEITVASQSESSMVYMPISKLSTLAGFSFAAQKSTPTNKPRPPQASHLGGSTAPGNSPMRWLPGIGPVPVRMPRSQPVSSPSSSHLPSTSAAGSLKRPHHSPSKPSNNQQKSPFGSSSTAAGRPVVIELSSSDDDDDIQLLQTVERKRAVCHSDSDEEIDQLLAGLKRKRRESRPSLCKASTSAQGDDDG